MLKCKLKKNNLILISLLFGIFLFLNYASASTLILNPTKDTYILQSSSNTNFGTQTILELIERTATGKERIYLNFNLNLSSSNITISQSKVCLYELIAGTTDTGSLYYLYNDWKDSTGSSILNETELTWNNQPCGINFNNSTNCNLTSLSTLSNLTSANNWYCWDINESIIKNYYNKNLSFAIKTPSVSNKLIDTFASKENITFKPYFYLNYSLPVNCSENWVQHNSSCGNYCGSWDKYQIHYTDTNNCGTNITLPADNGTCYDCNYCTPVFSCTLFNSTCSGNPPTDYTCLKANDTITCCNTTGLTSDCSYTGNLSDFDVHFTFDMLNNATIIVPSYPYVDLNTSYTIKLSVPTNNKSYIKLYLNSPDGINSTFNFSFIDGKYQITLLFTEEGNYPFIINGTNPCSTLTGQINGVFLVRKPYNITFCGFKKNGDSSSSYVNDFAYLIAEFTSSKKYYNTNLEQFITPLGFSTTFKTPVFHTLYRGGCGTFKLYEPNEEYAVRLFDGIATYQTTFSPPNISKTYGTNIFFGKYVFNGTDYAYNILFDEKDVYQYRWLFNWLFIIFVIGAIVVSIFLFFVIPEKPSLSVIFGIGFISMITLFRVILFIWKGW
jgi:hypothetical protein